MGGWFWCSLREGSRGQGDRRVVTSASFSSGRSGLDFSSRQDTLSPPLLVPAERGATEPVLCQESECAQGSGSAKGLGHTALKLSRLDFGCVRA